MKADNPIKKKAPSPPQDDTKVESEGVVGPISKLKIFELPVRKAITYPLILLLLALIVIGYTMITVGSPLHLGLDFKGGTMATIHTDKTDAQLQQEFSAYPLQLITHSSNGDKVLRFSTMDTQQYNEFAAYLNQNYKDATLEQVGGVFSASNQVDAVYAIIIAFAGMAITIFVIFRNFIPSVAVITSAFSDIICAAALMNVFGIELTFGTFAALIMLIGYSVDTDILLTTKILGERKYIDKKISSVRSTGLTMTISAIAAFLVLYLVSTFAYLFGLSSIPTLEQISLVMIFGLIMDMINTWMFNAGLLRWYMATPEAKAKYG
jgi:preprotein translocase subunit SecF